MFKLEVLDQPISDQDLNDIWSINQENIPEVGSVPNLTRMKALVDWSSHVIVVRSEEVVGFIVLMREGETYDSLNYDFFNSKDDPFLYVDRIAIKDTYRRQGLGSMLYEKTIEIAEYLELDTCCEVNTLPRNDASLSFHERFGFREVGTKDYDDHSVVYLIKSN